MIRPINTEGNYKSALDRVDELITFLNTKEDQDFHDELDVLGTLIAVYEKDKFPISAWDRSTLETVPFIDRVELFNRKFGRLVNEVPTLPSKAEVDFIYNFILEEAKELKDAYEQGNIVDVLDAILDQLYVGVGLATLSFGLKSKINEGFAEVQRSNMTKFCKTEVEAKLTVVKRTIELQAECHYEPLGDIFICYRTNDKKIIKSLTYSPPNLKQFFTEEELENSKNILIEKQVVTE